MNSASSKILYIDDNALNRSLVKRLLTNYGFEVTEAENGLDGIHIAQEDPPHLILMDVNMPGLDGHATTTRMRSIPNLEGTPIIAVTARITKGERELALAAGCDGYIPKPIDIDQFPQQIVAYLNGYRDTLTDDEQREHLDRYSHKLVERLEKNVLDLQAANERLLKIDKIKSDFITLAAHELRTPLSVAYGYAGIMHTITQQSEVTAPNGESISDLAHRIYEATSRLNEVVNDILNISLINANEIHIVEQPVSIPDVIQAALGELAPAEHGRQVEIVMTNLDELPFIFGDAKKLQQAFWNVLSNAIKFTPDGHAIHISGVSFNPETETHQRIESSQNGVIIAIKDTGIGIHKREQQEIFEQFYVVNDTTYHRTSKIAFGGGGLGLGLPIAKGIINAHNGDIWVESPGFEPNQYLGSTFYIFLPTNEFSL